MDGQNSQARPPTRMSQHGDESQKSAWHQIKNALCAPFGCCYGRRHKDFRDLDDNEQPTRVSTPISAPARSRPPSVHELSDGVQRAIRAKDNANVPAQLPPSYERSIPPNPRFANQITKPPALHSPTARLVRKSSGEDEQDREKDEHEKDSEVWNKEMVSKQRNERLAREEEARARQYQMQLEKLRAARQRNLMENDKAETRLESSQESSSKAEQPLPRGPSAASVAARSQFQFQTRHQQSLDNMHAVAEVDTPAPPARVFPGRIASGDLSTLPSMRRRLEEAQQQEAGRRHSLDHHREDSAEETRAIMAVLTMESEYDRAAASSETPFGGRPVELPATPETPP
ncbi:hypothetical protein CERZMDRAFT_94171 [Cercospora zeae-maydis SCOH1-5]|uniref:Uncharacterized protein n=1 Tax=Cercospora zeae-maydis SCOH1-5 TaxID=717836 RepID=A0A6A6FRI2_9PEZI|nr:hypothetical protein CERZMDRAFT_94171 [Cercospora zeae-maydis SCOH1-5]